MAILYLKDKIIYWNLGAALTVNLFLWALFYFRIPIQVEPIVLRYNIYVGINLIGSWQNVFYFPLAGLGIILLNFILAKIFYKPDKLAAYFLVLGALIAQIILFVFGALIVMINA